MYLQDVGRMTPIFLAQLFMFTHGVSQLVVHLPGERSGLHRQVILVVGAGRRLGQVHEVVARPRAPETDLVQALQHGQHRTPGLYLNMADGNPAGTKK